LGNIAISAQNDLNFEVLHRAEIPFN